MNFFSTLLRTLRTILAGRPSPAAASGPAPTPSLDPPVRTDEPRTEWAQRRAALTSDRAGGSTVCAVWQDASGLAQRRFGTPGGDVRVAYLDAVAHVVALAGTDDADAGPTRVFVADRIVREGLLGYAASFPALRFVTDPDAEDCALLAQARRLAARRDAPTTPRSPGTPATRADAAAAVPAPLTVATDASRGRVPGLGLACIAEDGRHAVAYRAASESIHAGELRALRLALDTFPGVRLRLLTDSRLAVAWIADPAAAPTRALRALATPIAAEVRRRRCEVTWVRGHAGHPLNEAADRLAVAARRGVQLGQPADVCADIARRIASELSTAA
nr:hypothetical protein [Propionibacterium sp.]